MIELSLEHNVMDTTKIKSWMVCPRKCFLEHFAGLRPDVFNNHLAFGTATHSAFEWCNKHKEEMTKVEIPDFIGMMDSCAAKGLNPGFAMKMFMESHEILHIPYRIFLHKFFEDLPEDMDKATAENMSFPKTPEKFAMAFLGYLQHYHSIDYEIEDIKIGEDIGAELKGTFQIARNTLPLAFRMDRLVQGELGPMVREMKTGGFFPGWEDQWFHDLQPRVYSMAIKAMYDLNAGVEIDGILISKNKLDREKNRAITPFDKHVQFIRVPLLYSEEVLQDTAKLVVAELHEIERAIFVVQKALAQGSEFPSEFWPKKFTQCQNQYNRPCIFRDLCSSHTDVFEILEEVPFGFKQFFWNPLEEKGGEI